MMLSASAEQFDEVDRDELARIRDEQALLKSDGLGSSIYFPYIIFHFSFSIRRKERSRIWVWSSIGSRMKCLLKLASPLQMENEK